DGGGASSCGRRLRRPSSIIAAATATHVHKTEDSVEQGADRCALFIAHPGHELLVYGWMHRFRPRVFVVTDGSGHGGRSRLAFTGDLLRSARAAPGSVFGRFTDRQLYAALLDGEVRWATDLASELASFLIERKSPIVVTDAAEG